MTIKLRLKSVINTIREAEKEFARPPGAVQCLAVSKTHSHFAIRDAFEAGQRDFGENYLQEALEKQQALADLDIVWHFIGPIQSNKTQAIASHFDWVHSVDRLKIAERLSAQRPDHLPDLNLLIQVNIDAEDSKSGVLPDALLSLAQQIVSLPNLKLRGLMAIPKAQSDFDKARQTFLRVQQCQSALNDKGFALDTLSIGMSNDFRAAIAAGSTMVRIGTAIFGPRET